MKKLLLSLLVLLSCVMSMNATEFKIDFTSLTPSTTTTGITISSSPFTFTAEKGASSTTSPTQNSRTKDIRLYANCTFKIECTNGKMTTAVFSLSSAGQGQLADISSNTGSVDVDVQNWTVTWKGDSTSSIVLTVGATNAHGTSTTKTAGQFDFDSVKIEAKVNGKIIQTPIFSVPSGVYTQVQNVELSCATANASIHYTMDGTDPTDTSTLYTKAISVTKTATIKAIAISGIDKSGIGEATYNFPVTVADVASFQKLDDNTYVLFSNPIVAIFQKSSQLYVKDATGYLLVYGKIGQTYSNGDEIAAGIIGVKSTYNNVAELTSASGFTAGTAGTAVEPVTVSIDGLTEADINKYIKLANVAVDLKNLKCISGEKSIGYHNSLGASLPSTDGIYDVVGFVTEYNKVLQILPVTVTVPDGINDIEATTVNNAKTYDVQGRQISAPVKGQLYIKANKKFIAK